MRQQIFSWPNVPVLQNRGYDSNSEARHAPTGQLRIILERDFAWNDDFDPELMHYDDEYDNSVPSSRFNAYYDQIADHLAATYDLSAGPVVDVGCGKGTFLKRMAARYDIQGIGIDPSYEGPASPGKLQFIAEKFDKSHIARKPSLVLCRHTLEHIPDPSSFLKSVLCELPASMPIPVFCEVPDLDWIIEQRSWWDFCYEHVNYFTSTSFHRCLQSAGCGSVSITSGFEGQYLWAEGTHIGGHEEPPRDVGHGASQPEIDLNRYVQDTIDRIGKLSYGRRLVIWGMATKGVMYALHSESLGLSVHCGVDINPNKQGKFAPVTGVETLAPKDLSQGEKYAVVCVNPNYSEEVRSHLERLRLDFILLDP